MCKRLNESAKLASVVEPQFRWLLSIVTNSVEKKVGGEGTNLISASTLWTQFRIFGWHTNVQYIKKILKLKKYFEILVNKVLGENRFGMA